MKCSFKKVALCPGISVVQKKFNIKAVYNFTNYEKLHTGMFRAV